jgi:mannose-6-phosphate isomerase-like protein (cupin superfamily)
MSVMDIVSLRRVVSFTTKDGSEIRELHRTEAQSLAEATLEPDQATQRHYHRRSEEIYVVLKGSGDMEIDGEHRRVTVGDAVLIPPGAWHTLHNNGTSELRILCSCAPPYAHDDTYFE